jgi:hypothetical protein
MPTIYEAAGGSEGMRRLVEACRASVMHSADDVPDGLEIPRWSWGGLVRTQP